MKILWSPFMPTLSCDLKEGTKIIMISIYSIYLIYLKIKIARFQVYIK